MTYTIEVGPVLKELLTWALNGPSKVVVNKIKAGD